MTGGTFHRPWHPIRRVNRRDDAPAAVASLAATNADAAVSGRLTASDVDASDVLTFALASGPSNGTVVVACCIYTPNVGYGAEDAFTFLVDDGNGGTDTQTVSISVSGDASGSFRRPIGHVAPTPVDTEQRNSQIAPSVADPGDRGHVVVWSSLNQDGGGCGVYCQRFAADGSDARRTP